MARGDPDYPLLMEFKVVAKELEYQDEHARQGMQGIIINGGNPDNIEDLFYIYDTGVSWSKNHIVLEDIEYTSPLTLEHAMISRNVLIRHTARLITLEKMIDDKVLFLFQLLDREQGDKWFAIKAITDEIGITTKNEDVIIHDVGRIHWDSIKILSVEEALVSDNTTLRRRAIGVDTRIAYPYDSLVRRYKNQASSLKNILQGVAGTIDNLSPKIVMSQGSGDEIPKQVQEEIDKQITMICEKHHLLLIRKKSEAASINRMMKEIEKVILSFIPKQ